MLSKRSLVAGLVLVFLAMLAVVMAGGRGPGSATDVDFRIDISRLGEPCKYWAPSPPNNGTPGPLQLHSGLQSEVLVSDPGAVSLQLACTDRPTCLKVEPELACFLAGEHYIRLQMNSPMAGCVWFTLKGLRGAATSIRIDGARQPFQYLSPEDDGVNMVCGLQPNQVLEMRMMMCPSGNGWHSVDSLFWDILATARLVGIDENHPDWDYRFDHDEDGAITMFGDVFAVMFRYGLDCDDFDY